MAVGAVVGGTILGGLLSAYGAHEQSDAATQAAALQAAAAEDARRQALEVGGIGAQAVSDYGGLAGQYLQDYGAQGLGELYQGRDLAAGQMLGYGGQAQQALQQGYASSTGLTGYAQQAANMADTFQGQSRLQQLMSDPSGYMAQDPGYQFRLGEGQKAVERAMAAHGGRASPAAMKEYAKMAQGLASQEFGSSAQRAQAADAATLQALGQQSSIQAGLGGMGYQAQQQLGQGLAGQYTGLGSNLSNLYTGTGSQLAQYYGGLGGNMSNLMFGIGQGQANALAGAGQTAANISQAALPAMAGAVPYTGGMYGALGQGFSTLGTNIGTALAGGYGQPQQPLPNAVPPAGGTGGATGIPGVNLP